MSETGAPTPPPPPESSSTSGGAPPPPSAPPPGGASPNRSLMLVLSYLWLLALIPFLMEQQDKEVKWHARHGLVLTGAEILLWIGLFVLNMIIGTIFAPLACVTSIAMLLLWLAVVVVHIICIAKAIKGERFLIPGVSQYADKIP